MSVQEEYSKLISRAVHFDGDSTECLLKSAYGVRLGRINNVVARIDLSLPVELSERGHKPRRDLCQLNRHNDTGQSLLAMDFVIHVRVVWWYPFFTKSH